MEKNRITSERLRYSLDAAHMSQQELADKSGVAKASISQYVNGYYAPSNRSAGKMAKVLNVSPVWLMGFDVPMERSSHELLRDAACSMAEEQSLLERYRKLNEDGQEEVLRHMDYLLSQDRYRKDAGDSTKRTVG